MVLQAEAEVKMRRRKEGKREKYPENFCGSQSSLCNLEVCGG